MKLRQGTACLQRFSMTWFSRQSPPLDTSLKNVNLQTNQASSSSSSASSSASRLSLLSPPTSEGPYSSTSTISTTTTPTAVFNFALLPHLARKTLTLAHGTTTTSCKLTTTTTTKHRRHLLRTDPHHHAGPNNSNNNNNRTRFPSTSEKMSHLSSSSPSSSSSEESQQALLEYWIYRRVRYQKARRLCLRIAISSHKCIKTSLKASNESLLFSRHCSFFLYNRHFHTRGPQPSAEVRKIEDLPGGQLVSGAYAIPHPAKRATGGEDAFFISQHQKIIGVADGVGGWAEENIDAGVWARALMNEAKKIAEGWENQIIQKGNSTEILPLEILETAYTAVKDKYLGSSTALIILLDQNRNLQYANLGDSGFMIVRAGNIFFRSKEQQHSFNFPYQIGHMEGDRPKDADVGTIAGEAGDVVVVGTDGLFDNLFDEQIREIVNGSLSSRKTAEQTAEGIAREAFRAASRKTGTVPWGKAYRQHVGGYFPGGKLDDITVVVSYVS
jgi:serine/threonine protein phosphatase PrpC